MKKSIKIITAVLSVSLFITALCAGAHAEIQPGDCNGDGVIDNKDVVTLFRLVSGSVPEYNYVYDVNGDGFIDNKDVVALFRSVSTGVHTHKWSEWNVTKPTCTKDGSKERKCLTCGKTEKQAIPATGHVYTNGKSCIYCGEKLKDTDNKYFNYTLSYEDEAETYEISAANPFDMPETVVIPDTYNGKPVTKIAEDGFAECEIKTVILGSNVKYVSDRAFEMCRELEDVYLQDGLVSIGEEAFFECALKTVDIPDTVTEIGNNAFGKCNIKELAVGKWIESTVDVCESDYDVYVTDINYYGLSDVTSVTIKDNVTEIPDCAFSGCENLKTVIIGDGVAVIGDKAFYGCALSDIKYGKGLKYIGNEAFCECRLTDIIIPEGVTGIGDRAFAEIYNIKKISVPSSLETLGADVFGYYENCFTEYENCRYLGNDENPCVVLTEMINKDKSTVKINEKTRIIYHGAFSNSELRRVNLPEGIINICDEAFRDCRNLTNISIPDSVAYYGSGIFLFSDNIKCSNDGDGYYLGNTSNPHLILMSVNKEAESFTIRENTRFIEREAFADGNITEIVIPSSVECIGDRAFSRCYDLETVRIENSKIAAYMFEYCLNLQNVTLSTGVSSIGAYAFINCDKFYDITYEGTLDQWQSVEKDDIWWWSRWGNMTVHCTDGDLIL